MSLCGLYGGWGKGQKEAEEEAWERKGEEEEEKEKGIFFFVRKFQLKILN
jgi:hypothetical protein